MTVTDVNLPKTMQCITFQGVGKVALSEVPTPRIIRPTDALIKVTLCSICGSDLHPFHGRETGIAKGTVVGHEFVGNVVAVGKQVTKVAVGDRVMSPFTACCGGCFYCSSGATCRCSHPEARLFGWVEEKGPAEVMKETVSEPQQNTGGFALHGSQAQYVRVPLADATLSKLPSAVSDEEGILLGDILSTAFFCAENGFHGSMGKGSLELQRAAGEGADDTLSPTVLVVGCGPVGLLAVLASKYFGAGKIWAADSVPERLALASKMGATTLDLSHLGATGVVEQVKAGTDGRGADVVLELVGSGGALKLAFDALRPMGSLSSVGVHTDSNFPFSPQDGYNKNIRYFSGRCPARYMMDRLLPLVEAKHIDFTQIITHRLSLSQGVEGYDMFSKRSDGCIKVVLDPWK